MRLPGHEYHRDCIDPWLLEKSTACPMCKQNITSGADLHLAGASCSRRLVTAPCVLTRQPSIAAPHRHASAELPCAFKTRKRGTSGAASRSAAGREGAGDNGLAGAQPEPAPMRYQPDEQDEEGDEEDASSTAGSIQSLGRGSAASPLLSARPRPPTQPPTLGTCIDLPPRCSPARRASAPCLVRFSRGWVVTHAPLHFWRADGGPVGGGPAGQRARGRVNRRKRPHGWCGARPSCLPVLAATIAWCPPYSCSARICDWRA